MPPLLSVKGLTLRRDDGTGSAILSNVNLEVEEGEVVILKGQSGSGKTTLLRCIAELNVCQSGEILLHGKPSTEYGIPTYRTLVQYVPQRPSLLPKTPLDFLTTVRSYRSRQKSSTEGPITLGNSENNDLDPLALAEEWGIEKNLWTRSWGTLSGGESQRIALAIAVGVGGAEVILLDEPTSALDETTMQKVEKSLLAMLPPLRRHSQSSKGAHQVERKGTGPKALIWITHEGAQAERCGTRTIDVSKT